MNNDEDSRIMSLAESRGLKLVTDVGASGCDLEIFHYLRIEYSEYQRNRQVADEFMKEFKNVWVLGPTLADLKGINNNIDMDALNYVKVIQSLEIPQERKPDTENFVYLKIYSMLNRGLDKYDKYGQHLCFQNIADARRLYRTDSMILDVNDDEMIRKVAEIVEHTSKEITEYFKGPLGSFKQDLDDAIREIDELKHRSPIRRVGNKK